MVEISEIKNRENLRLWLREQPQETTEQKETLRVFIVWLGYRAAMRVFPIFFNNRVLCNFDPDEERVVTYEFPVNLVLWCLISATVVSKPRKQLNPMPDETVSTITSEIANAARAVVIGETDDIAQCSLKDAIKSLPYLIDGLPETMSDWSAVRADCGTFAEEMEGEDDGLWIVPNPILDEWQKAVKPLGEMCRSGVQTDLSANTPLWVMWYQGALDGHPMDPKLVQDIIAIDSEIWRGSFSGLMDAINAICNAFIVEQAALLDG